MASPSKIADIDAQDLKFGNALEAALGVGHAEIVEQVVEKDSNNHAEVGFSDHISKMHRDSS